MSRRTENPGSVSGTPGLGGERASNAPNPGRRPLPPRASPPAKRRRLNGGLPLLVLAGLLAGCAATPRVQPDGGADGAPTVDCPSHSTPVARDLAITGLGLAVDAVIPGASLVLDAAELAGDLAAKGPPVATTGILSTPTGPIAYSLEGSGSPALVFQSGLGDGKSPWGKVLARAARDHRVFAYDRPGYGDSPAVEGPRDPCTVASELHGILRVAGVRPPLILVGHSLGGLYQRVYARLYPEEVAGLVLLDPTHPEHWERMQRQAPGAAAWVRTLRGSLFTPVQRREFDDQARCLEALDLRTPPPVPARLLVRTRYEAIERGGFETMIHTLEADWQRSTGAPAIQRVCDAGHFIQRERPEAVLAALAELRAELAGRTEP